MQLATVLVSSRFCGSAVWAELSDSFCGLVQAQLCWARLAYKAGASSGRVRTARRASFHILSHFPVGVLSSYGGGRVPSGGAEGKRPFEA